MQAFVERFSNISVGNNHLLKEPNITVGNKHLLKEPNITVGNNNVLDEYQTFSR